MWTMAPDSTDATVYLRAVDSISGLPKTGLTYTDVTARYVRTRAAAVTIAPASLAGPDAAHAEGGFVEVDAVYAQGLYRLDVPDAAVAAGADFVAVIVQATHVLFAPIGILLASAISQAALDELHLCKAVLANKRVRTLSDGADVVKDDDGETNLVTLTPAFDGVESVTRTPS